MTTNVIILSNDEAEMLRHSLPRAISQPGVSVTVVDNASIDGTASVASEHGADCLRLPHRVSYSEAMNAGLTRADGEAVLFLNADCFLEPGFLEAALPRLREPEIGSVAPKLMRAAGPGPGQRLGRIDTVGIVMHRCRKNLLAGHGAAVPCFERAAEVFGADGAAALYRRETLGDCMVDGELFDPELELWGSDVDVAWRARVRGWRCLYEPRAVAYHVRSYRPDTRRWMPERDRRLVFRNRYLLIAKNDRPVDLVRDLHHVAAYEALALGHALIRERHLLRAYVEALRALPRALRRRRSIYRRPRGLGRPRFGRIPPLATRSAGRRAPSAPVARRAARA